MLTWTTAWEERINYRQDLRNVCHVIYARAHTLSSSARRHSHKFEGNFLTYLNILVSQPNSFTCDSVHQSDLLEF